MKKVGILTFYLNHNYGSTMQCFALKKVIESISEYQVEIIPHTFVDRIVNGFGEPELYENYNRRIKLFDEFLKNEIGCISSHISHLTMENAPREDYYIVGSDVVWDVELTHGDKAFFLDFVGDIDATKIAYAPSLNVMDTEKVKRELFERYLEDFDYVSVREASDIGFVQQYTSKNVIRVLDPTLLLEQRYYEEILPTDKKRKKRYILLYLIYEDTENIQRIINYVNRISLERDLDIVHFVYNIPDYVFGDRGHSFAFEGPKDFLWYVKNADLVITNSFHGVAFSIIFKRSFYTSIRPKHGNKISSILNELDIKGRILPLSLDTGEVEFELDYSKIDKKLAKLQEESYKFLKESLNITDNGKREGKGYEFN